LPTALGWRTAGAEASCTMSEETPEEDGRINHASGVIAAGKGKIKITQAMKLHNTRKEEHHIVSKGPTVIPQDACCA